MCREVVYLNWLILIYHVYYLGEEKTVERKKKIMWDPCCALHKRQIQSKSSAIDNRKFLGYIFFCNPHDFINKHWFNLIVLGFLATGVISHPDPEFAAASPLGFARLMMQASISFDVAHQRHHFNREF